METTTRKQQQIEIVLGNYQEAFRVVTIVPLQLLQSRTREKRRVLGRRVQPSGKKKEYISPDSRTRRGLGPMT